MRKAGLVVALAALLGSVGPSWATENPGMSDLPASGVLPSDGDLPGSQEVPAAALLAGFGDGYQPFVLLGALSGVEQAVSADPPGMLDSGDVQVLYEHSRLWKQRQSEALGSTTPDFDGLFEATLAEQAEGGQSRAEAYGTVAADLEALYRSTTAYHMSLSLTQHGKDGYQVHGGRDPGQTGLDAEQHSYVAARLLSLRNSIAEKSREIRDRLQKG